MSLLDQLPEMDPAREAQARAELAGDAESRRKVRQQREDARRRARHTDSEIVRLDNLTKFLLSENRRLRADVDVLLAERRKGRTAA